MLDTSLKTQLKAYLDRLTQPVVMQAFLDDGPESRNMATLLDEIVALNPLLSWSAAQGVNAESERIPSFAIGRPQEPARIRFAGIPLGHEFTSLVLALLHTGGHPPKVEPAVLDQIRALPGDHRFETYISLTCQNCPDVVQALNLMSAINPRIRHVMIDGALFQDEVQQRQIMAVPTVFHQDQLFGQGRTSLEAILERLDHQAAGRAAEALAEKPVFDMLVVGGGPAGAAAAIYAARKGIRTGLVAERLGGQVLDTLGIENFISVQHTEGPQLAAALENHVRDYQVDIMNLQRAQSLIPASSPDEPIQITLASGATLRARSVVVCTGARWRNLNVPGEDTYRNRGVAYCPHCDGPLFRGKRVAVVGGGNSGVEAAIDLAGIVEHVTLLEYGPELKADAILQRKLTSLPNVTVLRQAQTLAVLGDGNKVTALRYRDRATQTEHDLTVAGLFVQIGLLPNTDWLQGTLNLSRHGEIDVDARGQTSVQGVFAAGDATTVPFKQIIIAMGEGAKAALGAFDHLIRTAPAPSSKDVGAT
jgi:alkyl hydroperoxide reductase subunit F